MLFPDLGSRRVVADFSGGTLSSDGGALLLRQIDHGLGLSRSLAACFTDRRDPEHTEFTVQQLLSQRLLGMALKYEDLNDHDQLRYDPLLAAACEKIDPLGRDRTARKGRPAAALAGSSTLNRLELSNNKQTRYHKTTHDPELIEQCLLIMGTRCLPKHAREIVLDLDAMGHLLHGNQEGRHYLAYYDNYCYLPLYIFCGEIPLWAHLRPSDKDGADGVVPALEKIVAEVRARCPQARIIVRGDGGFCRDEIMVWCEAQGVYYCLGLSKNSVLIQKLQSALADARARYCLAGGATTRVFTEFDYQTGKSWSCSRRVVGKAEVSAQGDNPRFVVTNLPAQAWEGDPSGRFAPQALYEEFYCQRGEMENVLKQQVLDLEGDRMSSHHMASNQLRLWFSVFAYLMLERLRSIGCWGSELARATVGTIRLKLLKVAAQVQVSVRRVYVRLNSAYPLRELFELCRQRLSQPAAYAT